ncbi:MAG: hypothetical protein EBU90_07485 [Proteobacteria bacterium]|nr:hypothetical protein [Pseudomonadota bacterium]NBP13454.1 hypothetical protein [bacterium]
MNAIMDSFEVYKYYMALKLHFTTDKYDIIEQKGKVRASRQAFAKRKDLYAINKVAKTYSDEEVANFLIANFVSGDRWGGVFDTDARETYLAWKKRIEGITYTFEKDLDTIELELEEKNEQLNTIFNCSRSEHPYIIKAYLRKSITIETLVILDKLYSLTGKFDKEINDTIVWPDISRLIKKYKPFLIIDTDKFNAIFRRRFGHQ